MKSSINYNNRLVDLEVLQTVKEPSGVQRVTISLVQDRARIVTGIEKLVQRYALYFLSTVGEVIFDPTFGTEFVSQVSQGIISDYGQLLLNFATANTKTLNYLLNNSDGYPTDEQIASATLDDFNLDFDNLSIYLRITITTQAGETIEFITPVDLPRA